MIKNWYLNFIKKFYHKSISKNRPKYSPSGNRIFYADINKLITPQNPCCVGDVVITENGWDCGLVAKVDENGCPISIYAGSSQYSSYPHFYGGVIYLDWYKTSYKMSYEEWLQLIDEKYYNFRTQVRQKEVVENKNQYKDIAIGW